MDDEITLTQKIVCGLIIGAVGLFAGMGIVFIAVMMFG